MGRGAGRWGGTVAAFALVSMAAGCQPTDVFACGRQSECDLGGLLGTCEPDGYCSYMDESCGSGSRYGPHAGAQSNTCVDAPPGTGTTSGSTATTTLTTAATAVTGTDDSGSDSSGEPACGLPVGGPGIWIDRETVAALPTDVGPFATVLEEALDPVGTPMSAVTEDGGVEHMAILARAMMCVRQPPGIDAQAACDEALAALLAIAALDPSVADASALRKKLTAFVVAADLLALTGADRTAFEAWLVAVRDAQLVDANPEPPIPTLHGTDPGELGAMAGSARVAIAAYLRDEEDLARSAEIFEGWLGNRDRYAGFDFDDIDPATTWHADPASPRPVNPAGAMRDGFSIDGVLPESQASHSEFTTMPGQLAADVDEPYGALEGAVAQALMLHRRGFDPWLWEDEALRRAVAWLRDVVAAEIPGRSVWLLYPLAQAYCEDPPTTDEVYYGNVFAFTDWTHGGG